jgi:hypothetical protein
VSGQYKRGDRVRDRKWGGRFVGTVRRVDRDGDLYVRWDGLMTEDQMRPDEVELLR